MSLSPPPYVLGPRVMVRKPTAAAVAEAPGQPGLLRSKPPSWAAFSG